MSAFRSRTPIAFAAALLAVSLVPALWGSSSASAQTPAACLNPGAVVTEATLRFGTVASGNLVATGNTLGLAKQENLNGPGTADSIGTFIALDPTSVDDNPANPLNPWFAGTTEDWTLNGSSADLLLPDGAEVLHAELVWGGSYADPTGVNSIAGNLEDPVRLIFGADEELVAPEGAGITTAIEPFFHYYARSADVTTFVQDAGLGTFTVSGVPGKATDTINSVHAAGWTLIVAYRDQAQPIRNLNIFFGGEFVNEDSVQDYAFSGFCAPPTGALTGSAIITALEGDADLEGDVLCIAPDDTMPDGNTFVGLSGPNNPAGNFFASQINDAGGELDTSGTFGDRNHDVANATNVSGGRQGWDITEIGLSSANGSLTPAQTGATMRTATLGDSYLPTAAAFSIDVNAPFFDPGGDGNGSEVSVTDVEVGDSFVVTVELTNSGAAPADGLSFTMPLPTGLSLETFTSDGTAGDSEGNAVQQAALGTGVDEGTLAPGETRTVVASLRVDAAPSGDRFFLQPAWTYGWVMCNGQDPFSEAFAGEVVSVDFIEAPGPSSTSSAGGAGPASTASSTAAAAGGSDQGAGGDSSGEGGQGGDGTDFIASGSGICSVGPVGPSSDGLFALGVAALGAALGLRRRRQG